jgi:hypothetical protein
MANSSLNLSSLDFDTLKQNLKNYLSTQSVLKDYNFDGSNMSVLLDVMSYNSYLNSFYLNMVASEMFLDSAQKLDSVVSHAKELNYVPRSYTSSSANVNFTLSTNGISSIISIPKNTLFTGSNANGTYSFVTEETYTYVSQNSTFQVSNLQIYEGVYVNTSFVMNYTDQTQKFVLPNEKIDLNSLTVTVYENNFQNTASFFRADTLFGLTSASNVFFVQAAQNNEYEILFGDGFLGRKPKNESLIVAQYRVVNGSDADGITRFTLDVDLGPVNGGTASVDTITVSANSGGGANAESIESIRFYAPRYFATQQRAVSSDDYSSIILSRFGGKISDVNVYGGELLEPKQYGRVAVCLKPSGSTITPDYVKNEIANFMLDYISVPSRIIITDPDYFYCSVDTTVQYNKNVTSKQPNEIKSVVLNAIKSFSQTNLEKFENDLRYSKFVKSIDDSDISITSNDTDIFMIKRLTPRINFSTTYVIEYGNQANYEGVTTTSTNLLYRHIITSSAFTYQDEDGNNYTNSYIEDDSAGKLVVYSIINNTYTIINSNIGSVDYTTGLVNINNLRVADYNNYISIYMRTLNKDIFINKSKVLLIDLNDVNVNIIETVG